MKIDEMVEEINIAVDRTLCITHYLMWELHSYKDKSLFFLPGTYLKSASFTELIEKAYSIVKEKI